LLDRSRYPTCPKVRMISDGEHVSTQATHKIVRPNALPSQGVNHGVTSHWPFWPTIRALEHPFTSRGVDARASPSAIRANGYRPVNQGDGGRSTHKTELGVHQSLRLDSTSTEHLMAKVTTPCVHHASTPLIHRSHHRRVSNRPAWLYDGRHARF
jgi:hypothetical protein